jgi:prophage regulatory protein
MNLKILSDRDVTSATTLSRSKLYELIANGAFPSPVRLGGGRRVGWRSDEIETWIREQIRVAAKAS